MVQYRKAMETIGLIPPVELFESHVTTTTVQQRKLTAGARLEEQSLRQGAEHSANDTRT
jgi:hypothetical protein